MSQSKVEIYPQDREEILAGETKPRRDWGWRLIAGNGEQVAQGEGHGSPRDAERAFRTVAKVIMTILVGAFEDGWEPYVELVNEIDRLDRPTGAEGQD